MALNTILLTIGIIALVESVFIILFPKQAVKICRKLIKNINNLKKTGLIELILAILLIVIGILI